jgi:putative PIN family toxin of toxin-antitoxin system
LNDRVLLDANVLISLALGTWPGGTIYRIFRLAALVRIEIIVATESLIEFRSSIARKPVLRRRFPPVLVESFIAEVDACAEVLVRLPAPAPPRCRDSRDDYLIEEALLHHTDAIVTGDDDLLVLLEQFGALPILPPGRFLEQWDREAGGSLPTG